MSRTRPGHVQDKTTTCLRLGMDGQSQGQSQSQSQGQSQGQSQVPGVTTRAFQDLAAKAGLGQNRAFDFLKDGTENGWVRREKGSRNSIMHYLSEGFDA